MGNIQSALRRTTRRRRATSGAKVMVRSDGTLSLDRRCQEWEEWGVPPVVAHTKYLLWVTLEFGYCVCEVWVGRCERNWTTALSRGFEWEALKIVIRGESLAKIYGIRKKLDRELPQQEDALNALQRQIDNGGVLENESQVVRGLIGAL
ncbi:hypothetical protein NDU88_004431 [Pleurodeles waltl]|uniref:RNase H type-1 domain-containing protein n=1 Tax=Pleurodeles waltl TaxID=8319 RepID=A0AAV7QFW2_PLEWA|nr:hypothetical protein NDU88_004431 [Pleurodeles waltl]